MSSHLSGKENIDYTREQIKRLNIVDAIDKDNSVKVAYAGVPGAFAEQALVDYFGDDVERVAVSSFKEVVEAIQDGRARFGVIPIENSSAGNIVTNYDLLSEYNVHIVGEQVVRIDQAFMVYPGTTIDQIETVYSHPQGLMQCSEFLEKYGFKQVGASNTAVSAKKVMEDKDPTIAAIASKRSAELYGLEILEPVANNEKNNATRFIVISSEFLALKGADKIAITFGLPHVQGSLYWVLGGMVKHNLNLTMIESRPIPNKKWEYYFYIEFSGNIEDEYVRDALDEIALNSTDLRVLGNYHKSIERE